MLKLPKIFQAVDLLTKTFTCRVRVWFRCVSHDSQDALNRALLSEFVILQIKSVFYPFASPLCVASAKFVLHQFFPLFCQLLSPASVVSASHIGGKSTHVFRACFSLASFLLEKFIQIHRNDITRI